VTHAGGSDDYSARDERSPVDEFGKSSALLNGVAYRAVPNGAGLFNRSLGLPLYLAGFFDRD
jgi:hypothetical protein